MNRNGMRPIHPGEILSEEFLKPLGVTTDALARSLNDPEAEISDVVNQRSGVSVGLAQKLSINLNTTPEFWLNLQSTYELRSAQIERG
ncbi:MULTISPECIES: HigA family addiction module antitoxin [Pseudomonas]|uniref:HigA family addiction module antitoxin n=1 Tax=Pseudomonas monachiensis TaxID=3060212 RepID=A0ABW9H5C2_9PSED|nr:MULTISPECIES: HigA family addiction module antitoxin [unclassified Pseudomonas]KRA90700.1 addiction module antidote protein HigA [Pseudomonas sp. Root68]KRB71939.1 addiction module antidote protein HigA [Pseudomonas sp. Root71]